MRGVSVARIREFDVSFSASIRDWFRNPWFRNFLILQILVVAISNVLVNYRFNLLGMPISGASFWAFMGSITVTCAAFSYPFTVVFVDLLVRLRGKRDARAVVYAAVVPAIVLSILLVYAFKPEGGWGVAARIGVASGTAFGVSLLLDVFVFQKIRDWVGMDGMRLWWLAPAVSTIFANALDTYVFFYVAFSQESWWASAAATQTVVKVVVGLVCFLPAYRLLLGRLQASVRG